MFTMWLHAAVIEADLWLQAGSRNAVKVYVVHLRSSRKAHAHSLGYGKALIISHTLLGYGKALIISHTLLGYGKALIISHTPWDMERR